MEKTKAAQDHTTKFERYPTYSLAVLWSMDLHKITYNRWMGTEDDALPIDGDAMARTRFQELRLADAWDKLNAASVRRLRNNHHEINRRGRDG